MGVWGCREKPWEKVTGTPNRTAPVKSPYRQKKFG